MKKLFNEFFYIPKHGKIREKVMLARVVTSITIIVMCLAAMSFSAYAYFSSNITSTSNIIKSANFEADVFINITTEAGELVPVKEESKYTKTAQLKVGNTYHVVLKESPSSTADTGFVIVSSPDCKEVYHTQQLGNDESVEGGRTEKITFNLSVTADTTVCFVSHWGTSSHYDNFKDKGNGGKLYITNANIGDNAVKMVINNLDNSVGDSKSEEKEITSDETTSSESTKPTENTAPESTNISEPTNTSEPSTTSTESTTTQPTDTTESPQQTSSETESPQNQLTEETTDSSDIS